MKVDYLIIGGGIAGLAAAIRLTELGVRPLLIEAGTYPAHKVCGEFISPSGSAVLKGWGLDLVPITKGTFHFRSKTYSLAFPQEAGSLSHWQLDPQLAVRAKQGGATLLVQTKVQEVTPQRVVLANGEVLEPKNLLIATGRLKKNRPVYFGYKAHYSDLHTQGLEMFSFPGGYMGVSPIEKGRFNVAALSRQKISLASHPFLQTGRCLFDQWMEVPVGSFGVKKTPDDPHCYYIGDAAGTIPPATGNGITMALLSGLLGAEYAYQRDAQGFKKAWLHRFRGPIFWGRLAHQLLMRPSFSCFTPLIPYFYKKTAL